MKLSIVIPAYNESKTLEELVKKVVKTLDSVEKEIIIVNDGSKDNTLEIANDLANKYKAVSAISNERNVGKTQTVKNGILHTKGEYVVIQDADLEYDPQDLLTMLKRIESDNLDVIYGNRFGKKNTVIYPQNWIGNTFLSFVSSIITGIRKGMWVRDMEVCYKMAKGDLYRRLAKTIESTTNFGFEPEITAKFSKVKNLKFAQVPISYYPRSIEEGKKMNALRDGLKALREIIYFNFFDKND